jgi:hypothetical protein
VVSPGIFGGSLIGIMNNPSYSKSPCQSLASTENRRYATNGSLWLCQKSRGENDYCACLLHSPALRSYMGGGFSSPSNSSQPHIISRVQSTCVHDPIFRIGVFHQNRSQKRWARSMTMSQKNPKIFLHGLQDNSITFTTSQVQLTLPLRNTSKHYFFRIRVSTL